MGHIEDQIFKFDPYTRRTQDLYKWYTDDIAVAFLVLLPLRMIFNPV